MSRPLTKQESDLIGRFGESIHADSKQNTATVLTPGRRTAVVLKLGKLYGFQNQSQPYVAFLTNIEFITDHHRKTLFSVTVDVYHSNGTLYKPNVYFYNLSLIQKRDERFPLKKDTIANNFEFWTTLDDNNDIETAFPHHSEIEYFRAALPSSKRKPSKNCRLNLRLPESAHTILRDLDHLKEKMQLPDVRVVGDKDKLVTIYGIQKNLPMKALLTIRRLDKLRDGQTVGSITDDGVVLVEKPNEIISFNDATFWKDLKVVHDFLMPTSSSSAASSTYVTIDPTSVTKGQRLWYIKDKVGVEVEVREVHRDETELYFTVKPIHPDHRSKEEIQTVAQYLAYRKYGGSFRAAAPMRKKTLRRRRRLNRSEKII
jgi:hypothetical protein